MKINREWHLANRMPANPTKEQRFAWHIEHTKHCNCRKMSEKLLTEFVEWKKSKTNRSQ